MPDSRLLEIAGLRGSRRFGKPFAYVRSFLVSRLGGGRFAVETGCNFFVAGGTAAPTHAPSTGRRRRGGGDRPDCGRPLAPDATLKHLTTLRDAGLLLTAPDPQDKRRTLYRLAPSVPVVKTETGMAIDFGFCVLLCRGKIQLAGILRAPEPLGKD